jgi:hypothetical protein
VGLGKCGYFSPHRAFGILTAENPALVQKKGRKKRTADVIFTRWRWEGSINQDIQ